MKLREIVVTAIWGVLVFNGAPAMAQQTIAHRGASFDVPENTIAAAVAGYELDADAVEIDIHLSKDKKIMVNHDHTTKRTGGEDLFIKDASSDELRRLDVGAWKNEKYIGLKMPFLEEVLEIVPKRKELFIEVKTGTEILPFLQQEIEKSGKEDQLVIISFNKEVVIEAKKRMPDIPVYWLLHTFTQYSMENAIQIAKENKLDGLDVHYKLVNPAFMQQMDKANLGVYVYTVNDLETARDLVKWKVEGITTDRPAMVKAIIKD